LSTQRTELPSAGGSSTWTSLRKLPRLEDISKRELSGIVTPGGRNEEVAIYLIQIVGILKQGDAGMSVADIDVAAVGVGEAAHQPLEVVGLTRYTEG
jgi:hypothetical protein